MQASSSIAVLVQHNNCQDSVLLSKAVGESHLQNHDYETKYKCDGRLLKQLAVPSFVDSEVSVSKMERSNSLIQVIEKLSKIVEKGRSKQCSIAGQKRPYVNASVDGKSVDGIEHSDNCDTTAKKSVDTSMDALNNEPSVNQVYFITESLPESCKRLDVRPPNSAATTQISKNFCCLLCEFVSPEKAVYYEHLRGHGSTEIYTCESCNFATTISKDLVTHKDLHKKLTRYQCNLCKFSSLTFLQLKEHFEQHGNSDEVVLMCSECCFISKRQEELEAHIWVHLEEAEMQRKQLLPQIQQQLRSNAIGSIDSNDPKSRHVGLSIEPGPRKWYTFDQHGMYRCLICSYACDRQRMLKTHAWKHAGEVDCSYPIFEEECESAVSGLSTTGHTSHEDEPIIVLSPTDKPENVHCAGLNQFQFCTVAPVMIADSLDCKSFPSDGAVKDSGIDNSKAPTLTVEEILVGEPLLLDCEQESTISDSLLSSAQKIINCSSNKAGHVNVIVERVPGAGDTVPEKHFLIKPDIEVEKRLISEKSCMVFYEDSVKTYQEDVRAAKVEAAVLQWNDEENNNDGLKSANLAAVDENVPPVRRRTNSESLRLHSLAAEVLVALPTRAPELTRPSTRIPEPDAGQRNLEAGTSIPPSQGYSGNAANVGLELEKAKSGFSEVPVKMGISMSLLTVIEKLRERTDQNASDEDILKELQDNAQCQPSSDLSSPANNLVEYIPNTERPYCCRLCHYSSSNKGYIKQHLRVHRQRQPYQCPICDHIAADSNGLESHMINHCKTRMYHCKQCNETFYYKSQLRNHEREQHSFSDISTAETNDENADGTRGSESRSTQEGILLTGQKLYKCDVCDYTSSTYVGVRNHRRIHSSDKPYRCSNCDFATTNMNSLKCHMRRHPQEQQAVQLLDQYRCSLCGYVCSHPPSLKSHMWKHASDQNYNYEQVNKAINEAISQSSRKTFIKT
ncbi:zinc finger protein 507 isoform X2 [Callorhinchus milii]|uniref:zinc finger protein 507 isoform X2 n=1 Tax=Callorhinchus milii TaxID=7868 RepID=UPI0004571F61|nr:zinc finger protein 507 isoform X2 [Callorhinchus milii]|eukprot:gi/632944553/ref/XP_007887570.1/ PREDICTED: zinc finger protein 507 isoform X2 [Callorhinchus milii]